MLTKLLINKFNNPLIIFYQSSSLTVDRGETEQTYLVQEEKIKMEVKDGYKRDEGEKKRQTWRFFINDVLAA